MIVEEIKQLSTAEYRKETLNTDFTGIIDESASMKARRVHL